MSSSSKQSDLFVGTPSPEAHFNRANVEVSRLLSPARQIQELPESVSRILSYARGSLYEFMLLQVQLIRNRSDSWNDHQMTVYDKVLLTLTSNGKDVRNIAAVVFFCNQYLGNDLTPDHKLQANISSRMQIQRALDELPIREKARSPPFEPASPSTSTSDLKMKIECKERQGRSTFATGPETTTHAELAMIAASAEPTLARLWTVLERAKQDYLRFEHRTDNEAAQAAKYLRDTAENAIQCLRDRDLDERLIFEAKRQYTRAERKVLELNGGKKRKFDSSETDHIRACPRAGSRPPSLSQDHNARRYVKDKDVRSRSKDHSRGKRRRSVGISNDLPKQRKKKQEGRGPSGIPYGYTRPVDQYTPVYHHR